MVICKKVKVEKSRGLENRRARTRAWGRKSKFYSEKEDSMEKKGGKQVELPLDRKLELVGSLMGTKSL